MFIFGSLLLTRGATWKRYIGLGMTTLYSLHLAIFTHLLPWTNYFNVFSNLLYITAAWTFSTPGLYFISFCLVIAPNPMDELMELPPLPRLPSGDFNSFRNANAVANSQQETNNNQSSK